MSKKKTELTQKDIETFLQEQFSRETKNIRPMIEGWAWSLFDMPTYDWDYVTQYVDRTLLKELITIFAPLMQYYPEERHLVHGDLGSNNIFTNGHCITAVLDWDCAKYGDPLFDIATAYFWSSWLDCMAEQAAYYEAHISNTTDYRERLLCYQLHIGLMEIHDNVLHQNWKMARWAAQHSANIASSSSY
jgi:hygromycin-B 4-O-kinase